VLQKPDILLVLNTLHNSAVLRQHVSHPEYLDQQWGDSWSCEKIHSHDKNGKKSSFPPFYVFYLELYLMWQDCN